MSKGVKGRTQARRAALQAIYQWHLNQQSGTAIANEFVALRELKQVDMEYFTRLTKGVPAAADALAEELTPHLTGHKWPEITLVERAALLVGAYELKNCPEVPYRVAINEAVELVKLFGAEDGYKLINGILDKYAAVARPYEVAARGRAGSDTPQA